MALPEQDPGFKLSRRAALKTAAVATGAGLVGTRAGAAYAADPPPPATTPFVEVLPIPAVKQALAGLTPMPTREARPNEAGRDDHQGWDHWPPQKYYSVDVKEANHSFHRELPTQKIWGYDGVLPGPTFVCRNGEPAIVRFYNKLPADTQGFGSPEISTHLHNGHSGSESDGYAGNYFSRTKYGPTISRAGNFYDHHFPNCYADYDGHPDTDGDPGEAMGTLWYHDHREGFTAANVYRGLAGFYLLFDKLDSGNENDLAPEALRLPSGVGQYDIPLVFQDQLFDSSGMRKFNQFETDGFLGNKFCVNGKVQPRFDVARRKYRFRLLDGGPSRFYEFYLVYKNADQAFTIIANDGNLLPGPVATSKLRMAPAERMDIVIDFSKYPIGSQLFLVNKLVQTNGRGPDGLTTKGTQLMRFDVVREAADNSQVPAILRPLVGIPLADVVKTRHFEFERENNVWVTNGKTFEVDNPMFTVKRGETELWTLQGKGSWHHPVHIHLEEGRILFRNGKRPPAHEMGRKDVFVLSPGEEVKILIRFRDFVGKYMMHCHNTVHEDHAMMVRFDVVD